MKNEKGKYFVNYDIYNFIFYYEVYISYNHIIENNYTIENEKIN